MVEKSVNLSSKNTKPVEITSQALASRPLARNLKVCGKKGARPSESDLAEYVSDAEVAGYLNTTKEFLLNKIAWELMNPDYQKRKPTTVKKKVPVNKTAASKKTSAAKTASNAESENKKRPSSDINYDLFDELFNDDNSPKRAKLDKPVVESSEECLSKPQGSEEEADCNDNYNNEDAYGGVRYQLPSSDINYDLFDELFNDENSPKRAKLDKPVVESSEECLSKPQGSEEEEEEEADCNDDYNNEDAYGGVEELYGDADLGYEDQDEGEYNEEIDW